MLSLVWAFPHGSPYCFRLFHATTRFRFRYAIFLNQTTLSVVSTKNINSIKKRFFLTVYMSALLGHCYLTTSIATVTFVATATDVVTATCVVTPYHNNNTARDPVLQI